MYFLGNVFCVMQRKHDLADFITEILDVLLIFTRASATGNF